MVTPSRRPVGGRRGVYGSRIKERKGRRRGNSGAASLSSSSTASKQQQRGGGRDGVGVGVGVGVPESPPTRSSAGPKRGGSTGRGVLPTISRRRGERYVSGEKVEKVSAAPDALDFGEDDIPLPPGRRASAELSEELVKDRDDNEDVKGDGYEEGETDEDAADGSGEGDGGGGGSGLGGPTSSPSRSRREGGGGNSKKRVYGTSASTTPPYDINIPPSRGKSTRRRRRVPVLVVPTSPGAKNSDAVDMDPHNHVKASRGRAGRGQDRGSVSVAEVLEVGIGGGCDDRLKEVIAVSRPRRRAATRRGNVNRNGEKLAAAASFDDEFLASSSPPSDGDDSDSEFGVGLDGPTAVPPLEFSMRKTRRRGGRAGGGKEEERGGDEDSTVTAGSSGILRDSDIDGGGGVGKGVVLTSSASARGRRTSRARASSRGRTMAGNGDANENDNDTDNENAPSTSAGSAPVRRRTRRKPPAEKIGGAFASPCGVVKKKAPKSKSPLVDLTLDGIDVGNDQEGGEIVSAIGGKDREDDRGGGVGGQGDIVDEPVDDESTAAGEANLNNGRENRKGDRGKAGVQVLSSDRGDNADADTDGGGSKYSPSASSGRRAHNRGEEERGKRRSSGPDGRNRGGEVAKSPLLTGQSPTERSGQGQVSRDPAGGKGGERDRDNGRSEVQEVEVAEDAEEVERMEEEEWEDGERPPVLSITVDMRSKSSSDRRRESSDRRGSRAHKRKKIDRSSSSVRREDSKGGSQGESDSEPKPVQDKIAGRNMKRSRSQVPPERAESCIRTPGKRDREGRRKVVEERGAEPPGRLCRPNGKPPKKSRRSREPPRRPEARQAYEVVSNLKRLCTEFVEGLSQEDEGGRNVDIARSIAGRFRALSGIQGCAEFGGGTSSPGSFRDVLEEAAEAHGVKKAVKIISSALYLVLNVVVRGAAGADNNPAAGVASNSGRPYRELCDCLRFFVGAETVPGVFNVLSAGSLGSPSETASRALADDDVVTHLLLVVADSSAHAFVPTATPPPQGSDGDGDDEDEGEGEGPTNDLSDSDEKTNSEDCGTRDRDRAIILAVAALHSVDLDALAHRLHMAAAAATVTAVGSAAVDPLASGSDPPPPCLLEALAKAAGSVHLLPAYPHIELALLFFVRLRRALSKDNASCLVVDSSLPVLVQDSLFLLDSASESPSGRRAETFVNWARDCCCKSDRDWPGPDSKIARAKTIASVSLIDVNATGISFFAVPLGSSLTPTHQFEVKDCSSLSAAYNSGRVLVHLDLRDLKTAKSADDQYKPTIYVMKKDSAVNLDVSRSGWLRSNLSSLCPNDSFEDSAGSGDASANVVKRSLKICIKRDKFQDFLVTLNKWDIILKTMGGDELPSVIDLAVDSMNCDSCTPSKYVSESDCAQAQIDVPPLVTNMAPDLEKRDSHKRAENINVPDNARAPKVSTNQIDKTADSANEAQTKIGTDDVTDKDVSSMSPCHTASYPSPVSGLGSETVPRTKERITRNLHRPVNHSGQTASSETSEKVTGNNVEDTKSTQCSSEYGEQGNKQVDHGALQMENSSDLQDINQVRAIENKETMLHTTEADIKIYPPKEGHTKLAKKKTLQKAFLTGEENSQIPVDRDIKKKSRLSSVTKRNTAKRMDSDSNSVLDISVPAGSSVENTAVENSCEVKGIPAMSYSRKMSLESLSALCFASAEDKEPLALPPCAVAADLDGGEGIVRTVLAVDNAIACAADSIGKLGRLVECMEAARGGVVSEDTLKSLDWVLHIHGNVRQAAQSWKKRRSDVDQQLSSLLFDNLPQKK